LLEDLRYVVEFDVDDVVLVERRHLQRRHLPRQMENTSIVFRVLLHYHSFILTHIKKIDFDNCFHSISIMECELEGRTLKYEDEKLFIWRENKTRNSYWFELKGRIGNGGYRRVDINKKYYLHRIVYYIHNPDWNIHDNCINNSIDHIDRNPLNNTIENLRVVTHQQNHFNRNAKGYYFHKASGKYQAYIGFNGKLKHLGCYDNKEDAHQAYLNAKQEIHTYD